MRKISALFLFLALWTGQGQALITWSTPGRACLFIEHAGQEAVFYKCYDGPQSVLLEGSDALYHPQAHDRYVLVTNSGTLTADLRTPTVYLPILLH